MTAPPTRSTVPQVSARIAPPATTPPGGAAPSSNTVPELDSRSPGGILRHHVRNATPVISMPGRPWSVPRAMTATTREPRIPATPPPASRRTAPCAIRHPGGRGRASITPAQGNGQYGGTSASCESCHLSRYNNTTNPNHAAAGFPRDCSVCHTTSGWSGASFNHSQSQFPLTGSHTSANCSSCHSSGSYSGLDTRCVACHQSRYNSTTDPSHQSAGFPTDCQVCHTTGGWTPASFNHPSGFSLTGAHTSAACTKCHVNGRYEGTPSDCYSCHQSEYRNVTSPNHAAAGFPQSCSSCHSTSTWSGATFTHRFPIYDGVHRGKWSSCTDCHTNSSNYGAFSCFGCHNHEKTKMDEKHRDNRNYVYNSANCYSCHPQGKGD
jgi:hypothetical protein